MSKAMSKSKEQAIENARDKFWALEDEQAARKHGEHGTVKWASRLSDSDLDAQFNAALDELQALKYG